MSSQMTLSIPAAIDDLGLDERLGVAVRRGLERALAEGLAPAVDPSFRRTRRTFTVGQENLSSLQALAQKHNLTVADTIRGLLDALIEKTEQSKASAAPAAEVAEDPGGFLNAEQRSWESAILDGMHAGNLVYAEASTGFGKGRVIMDVARSRCDAGDRVLIAAPTVAILSQLLGEWSLLDTDHPLALQIGRGQFVDAFALKMALDMVGSPDGLPLPEEQVQALRQWYDAGGKPLDPVVAGRLPGIAWLLDDALSLAPDLPAAAVELRRDFVTEANPSEQVYQQQKQPVADEAAPAVRLTTHAMLAVHVRIKAMNGSGVLPAFDSLLVDEGHQLEGVFAQQLSADLAPWGLMQVARRLMPEGRRLRLKSTLQRVERVARDYRDRMMGYRFDTRTYSGWDTTGGGREVRETEDFLDRISEDLERLGKSRLPEAGYFASAAEVVQDRQNRGLVQIEQSPVRRYPRVTIGPTSVARWLGLLWSQVSSAAIFSATLYTNTEHTAESVAYMSRKLATPQERVKALPSVAPRWVRENTTLHLPEPSWGVDALIPPGDGSTAEEEAAFFDAVAALIHRAWEHGGEEGVVVLLPSYRAVEQIGQRCEAWLPAADCIIQRRGSRLPALREQYHARVQDPDGAPVWLATGGAWTGLDLVLPDGRPGMKHLIVPRIPFMPGSSTDIHRRRKSRQVQRDDALILLRQGVGRLVRRPEHTDRHLWVLDGRLGAKTNKRHMVAPLPALAELGVPPPADRAAGGPRAPEWILNPRGMLAGLEWPHRQGLACLVVGDERADSVECGRAAAGARKTPCKTPAGAAL